MSQGRQCKSGTHQCSMVTTLLEAPAAEALAGVLAGEAFAGAASTAVASLAAALAGLAAAEVLAFLAAGASSPLLRLGAISGRTQTRDTAWSVLCGGQAKAAPPASMRAKQRKPAFLFKPAHSYSSGRGTAFHLQTTKPELSLRKKLPHSRFTLPPAARTYIL